MGKDYRSTKDYDGSWVRVSEGHSGKCIVAVENDHAAFVSDEDRWGIAAAVLGIEEGVLTLALAAVAHRGGL